MNVDIFFRQVQEIHGRLHEMYRGVSASVQPPSDLLLPSAFKELGTASEELQVAAEEMLRQTEELNAMREQLEAERRRYRDLFEFLPDAYLVTDIQGKILEANRATVALLNPESANLGSKFLISFIPAQERQAFRTKLNQLPEGDRAQQWKISMQSHQGKVFDAAVSVVSVRQPQGNPPAWRWIIRDISEQKRALRVLSTAEVNPWQNYPSHFYSKGEIIPLQSQTLWLVCQGLVKLTTMDETGNEVVIGLVGSFMPFGSSITALPTYQATALSQDVVLVNISLAEIAASPDLARTLLPKISDRLRQTESLLAISGKRQVKDRLYYLLLWLKQEIGEPIEQGTRLKVRFTHQDLADACCTTRVTITRLLGQLQKQGKIAFDSNNHICLMDEIHQKCG